MRKIFLYAVIAVLDLCSVCAQKGADWQNVTCISPSNQLAVFKSESASNGKKEVSEDAKCRLFFALFYKGVPGINENKPMIDNDNPAITAPFFNGANAFEAYIISTEGGDKVRKIGDKFHAIFTISVSIKLLTQYLQEKGVMEKVVAFGDEGGPLMPSIMTVPLEKDGESIRKILENNPDMRIAVANVQDGFRSRNVTTYDFLAALKSNLRGMAYEDNQGVADSNDRQLVLSSGSDVYVEVDLVKNQKPEGNSVILNLKAYETATGAVLASKSVITRSYPKASIDMLTKYAVRDGLQTFLDDICNEWKKPSMTATSGTRVVMRFSLQDGGVMMSFDDKVGPNNYSLSNVIRQWIRKNCFKGQYHQQKQMAELMLFDTVTMPPTDQDGFPMDAAQFAFLLESYLKETIKVDCSSRIDGNMILFTIL